MSNKNGTFSQGFTLLEEIWGYYKNTNNFAVVSVKKITRDLSHGLSFSDLTGFKNLKNLQKRITFCK